MTPASIALPDRPLVVRPPGAGLASHAWLILVVIALGAGLAYFLTPQVADLITDVTLSGVAVPVRGAHATGRCASHGGVLAECEAVLTAPGNVHRTVHYFLVDLGTGDLQVHVLADPARPALLTTDLALDHLWNRALTLALAAPLFASFVLGLLFATGKEIRRQRATVRALSNRQLRPVLLRMVHYTVGTWVVASATAGERSWHTPRRARPIVIDPDRRLILGVTAGNGAFTVPLDRELCWIGVDARERQALLEAIGPNPVGRWLAALDTPAMAAERDRWRRLARTIMIAGSLFAVAAGGAAWWAFGIDEAGDGPLLVFALCLAFAVGPLLGALRIRARAARHEAILR